MSSAHVGLSADDQGFLNAVPASLAQCDGRFLFSAPVYQEAHAFNIFECYAQYPGDGVHTFGLIHDVGSLYKYVEAGDDDVAREGSKREGKTRAANSDSE
jgi:hypothetical protein